MAFLNIGNSKRSEIQELKKRSLDFEDQIKRLKTTQELLVGDILSMQEATSGYAGNEYRDYGSAVQAIAEKYNGTAKWGVIQTGTIIDLRAAFILGEGINVRHETKTRSEAEAELSWIEEFLDYNDLDSEMAQEMAKEAEIEGKIAVRLTYEKFDKDDFSEYPGMVSARYISWLSKKYKITSDENDYMDYLILEYCGEKGDVKLLAPEFVYKKFGGRISNPNEAQPKIMKCLTQIDRLDKALTDLRKINHLFASPTPDFRMETMSEVDAMTERIKNINWKIGKAFIHTGELNFKGVDASGIQNLINEIELTIKMISGTTSIPIHYLGLLDLLSNRASAETTREIVMAATTKERETWIGAYEELITKAMRLFNAKAYGQKSTKLDPTKISVDIAEVSQDHWNHLRDVYIPAVAAGIISKESVAAQIPGIDIGAEAAREKEKEAKEKEDAREELEYLKAQQTANQFENDQKTRGRPFEAA